MSTNVKSIKRKTGRKVVKKNVLKLSNALYENVPLPNGTYIRNPRMVAIEEFISIGHGAEDSCKLALFFMQIREKEKLYFTAKKTILKKYGTPKDPNNLDGDYDIPEKTTADKKKREELFEEINKLANMEIEFDFDVIKVNKDSFKGKEVKPITLITLTDMGITKVE